LAAIFSQLEHFSSLTISKGQHQRDEGRRIEERISDQSDSYTSKKDLPVEAVLILQFIGPVEFF
jgi:hypothetical protein